MPPKLIKDEEIKRGTDLMITDLNKEIEKLRVKLANKYQTDLYIFSLTNISHQSWSHFHPYTSIKTPSKVKQS
jgi:hypothetical protein